MERSEHFFNGISSFDIQAHQRGRMQTEIAEMDENRLLNTNVDDLVTYLSNKFEITIPELLEDEMNADQHEAKRDVSDDPRRAGRYFGHSGPIFVTGTEIRVEVPFSGDAGMFKVRPNTCSTRPPQGVLNNDTITFHCWGENMTSEQVRPQIDEWLAGIKQHLQWQRESFRGFNEAIVQEARQTIERRREKLLGDQKLVAGLGIPLKRRAGTVTTYTAPEIKRKLMPKIPPATKGPYKPEPILEEKEYQHILGILESMVHVMERSPKAFHNIDEESLRTHFLISLNSHYEGQATGETFNYQGKTDILIRSGDRNIFIAECKFWGGPVKVTETIDQLLGYLSWRDSKTAILLFNRNKDFSKVLAAIPEIFKAHPNFQKDEGQQGETHFRYAFRHKDDAAKILHLTVMAFDVPSPDNDKKGD